MGLLSQEKIYSAEQWKENPCKKIFLNANREWKELVRLSIQATVFLDSNWNLGKLSWQSLSVHALVEKPVFFRAMLTHSMMGGRPHETAKSLSLLAHPCPWGGESRWLGDSHREIRAMIKTVYSRYFRSLRLSFPRDWESTQTMNPAKWNLANYNKNFQFKRFFFPSFFEKIVILAKTSVLAHKFK